MGFIQAELDKDKYKFISLEQIVLYVQSLDSDKPSLADTAKFLLRCYDVNDISFSYVDEEIFRQDIADNYIEVNINQGFENFLEFVATFDDFEYGITETGLNQYNQFANLFLPIKAVQVFLVTECKLKQPHNLVAFISNLDKSIVEAANESSNFGTPSIQILPPNANNQAAKIAELQAEITRLKSELAEYDLIQKHRKRAPEFNALIETLIYYTKEYNSDKQPLKRSVKETFNAKANLPDNNRRGEEVARVLGLPEKNS